jgi:hypothetical protein
MACTGTAPERGPGAEADEIGTYDKDIALSPRP